MGKQDDTSSVDIHCTMRESVKSKVQKFNVQILICYRAVATYSSQPNVSTRFLTLIVAASLMVDIVH